MLQRHLVIECTKQARRDIRHRLFRAGATIVRETRDETDDGNLHLMIIAEGVGDTLLTKLKRTPGVFHFGDMSADMPVLNKETSCAAKSAS